MKMSERLAEMTMRSETRDSILNNLGIPIYVSDMATNEILYVNEPMQFMYGDRPLIGMVCWEALKDETKRCGSCPIPYLLKHPGTVYHREIYNGENCKVFSCIIPWKNGELAHMQYILNFQGNTLSCKTMQIM